MTTVLVHPSRGAKDGRINLQRTLEKTVDINDHALAALLTPIERTELLTRHPNGQVRFWGTYEANRKKIERVREGDLVVFTGQGAAWAIGVVGYRFENDAFAKTLWVEHPEKGAYSHVYSLTFFEQVTIPYPVVNAPLGNSPANHFQAMAVYEGERADRLVDALRTELPTLFGFLYDGEDESLATALERDPQVDLLEIEKLGVAQTTYMVEPAERTVRRGENALVQAYAATLDPGATYGRERTPAGVTDLQIELGGTHELIEAKSSTGLAAVRQVLAQILHYAPSLKNRPSRVAGLFPTRPADAHVSLLNQYGIDVIFRLGPGKYTRLAAPDERRRAIRNFWASGNQ